VNGRAKPGHDTEETNAYAAHPAYGGHTLVIDLRALVIDLRALVIDLRAISSAWNCFAIPISPVLLYNAPSEQGGQS
jgi:hypothetical protein